MKRRSIFIMIMMSLFMFQSAWNVAAAFCVHEKAVANATTGFKHFGHHEPLASCETDHKQSVDNKNDHQQTQAKMPINVLNFQDHHDHLPSFSHILIIDARAEITEPQHAYVDLEPFFTWSNLYQSPDLGALTPPPFSSPLSVG